MNVLAVFAHPDDEVLAAGGALARHAARGDCVSFQIFTDGMFNRQPADRGAELKAAAKVLAPGSWLRTEGFRDQHLDVAPLADLARAVEFVLRERCPEVVYTHWLHDLNQDHRAVAEAVLIATRPMGFGAGVRRVLACEIHESTAQPASVFAPNYFVDIGKTLLKKVEALRCYESEKRLPPHPRSEANIVALAGMRGAAAGVDFAEAFVLLREVV